MRHKKGKLNPELLKEELKKHNLMTEYSFYVGEEEKDDELIEKVGKLMEKKKC